MSIRHWCVRCEQRQIQDWKWRMCRRCTREAGHFESKTMVEERERVARVHAKIEPLRRVEGLPAGPNPTRIIDGIEYEVTWDGTNN